jgi:hypothetical protein
VVAERSDGTTGYQREMVSWRLISAFIIGAGVAAAGTAGMSYFTRYSMFDALYAEIDSTLYLRITAVTLFEKAAIIIGIVAVLTGLAIFIVNAKGRRRPRSRLNRENRCSVAVSDD